MYKTIFITLSTRAVFRNLFFFPESVFFKLKKYAGENPGFRIVLLVPEQDIWKYEKVLGGGPGKEYFIEPMKVSSTKGLVQKLFYFFYSYLIYTGTTKMLATMAMRPDEPPAGGRRLLAPIKWFVANTFGRVKFIKLKIVPSLFLKIFKERPFKNLFEKYSPDVVFISHLYGWPDQHLLAEAKRQKVKTMGMAAGWDHLDKYFLPFHSDRLLAQSEEIKESAIKNQAYEPGEIDIVGYPYFDFIVDKNNLIPKTDFMKELSFPENARYVLYVSGSAYCPDEPDIIEKILSLIEEGRYGNNVYLVIRPYSGGRSRDKDFDYEKFNKFSSHSKVAYFEHDLWGDVEKSKLFANLLRYSDVVIALYTTVVLEASVFDRPLLVPAFDGYKRRPAYRSIKRFEEFEHFQDVLKSGALPRAYSFKQLDEFIGNYMKDQNIFADSRRILRERSCSFLDGLSSERILSEIKNV